MRDHVTAFRPISPRAALEILDAADVGVDCRRLLADLSMAGKVKGYAQLVETEMSGTVLSEVREGRIDRSVWRRVIAEGKVADVYDAGSVHLGGQGYKDRISVIGIRFDAASVASAAADHGEVAARPAPVPRSPRTITVMPIQVDAAPQVSVSDEPADAVPRRTILEAGTVSLSIAQTADLLGVSLTTVNNLIRRGELVVKKIGRRSLVQTDSIRALLDAA